jgi:hypothetical protein
MLTFVDGRDTVNGDTGLMVKMKKYSRSEE